MDDLNKYQSGMSGDFGLEMGETMDPFSPFDPSEFMAHDMTETKGMPTGPVGDGPGSFGFDDEFMGYGVAMIFGDEVGCDNGIKG